MIWIWVYRLGVAFMAYFSVIVICNYLNCPVPSDPKIHFIIGAICGVFGYLSIDDD